MGRFELVAAVVVLLGAVTAARATDVPITGLKLVVVDKTVAAGKAKAVFVAKDAGVGKGSGTDPGQIQATLGVSYDSTSGDFLLPQGIGWLVNKTTVAKYVNKEAPMAGVVKVGVIKPGKLAKVVGKDLGDSPLDISSAPSGVVYAAETIANGGEQTRLCTQFTGCVHKAIAGGTGYKLVCKGNSAGDPACTAATPVGGLIGCADGQREGFMDVASHPDIAGCSGGWDVPGTLNPVSTGCGAAGDDSGNPTGAGCGAADLCADGWHVCATPAEVAANSADGCDSATQGGDPPLFFAQRQSGEGNGECATTGANDLFGCGNMGPVLPNGTCTPLNRTSNDGCVSLPTGGWSCGVPPSTTEALDVVKTGADGGGVLCCRSPLTCTDGDFYCPAGCGLGNDNDCASCFADLGETVLDTCTNLEWEKKDTAVGSGIDAGNLHDVDNAYRWAGLCSVTTTKLCQPDLAAETACKAQTDAAYWASGCEQCTGGEGTCTTTGGAGTTAWDWLAQVNAATYAGHNDWRLPYHNVVLGFELSSILLPGYPCATSPCIDSIFGPTASDFYWSGSTYGASVPNGAWAVNFSDYPYAGSPTKTVNFFVRAVRGSS